MTVNSFYTEAVTLSNRSEAVNDLARQYVAQRDEREVLKLWELLKPVIIGEAKKAALRYPASSGLEFDDFVQSGWLALVGALEHYDPDRAAATTADDPEHGGSFTVTFRFYLLREYDRAAGAVRAYERDALRQNGTESLDAPVGGEDDDITRLDLVALDDHSLEDAEQRVYLQQLRAAEEKALDTLPPREAEAIRRRFFRGETLEQIGRDFGIGATRARQLEYNGMRRIRMSKASRELRGFTDFTAQCYRGTGRSNFERDGCSVEERVAIIREEAAERARLFALETTGAPQGKKTRS